MDNVSTIMVFLEFLVAALTFHVVMNYVSALNFMFSRNGWKTEIFENAMIKRLLRGINYTVHVEPSPKGIFTLHQLREISRLCEIFESSLTY